MQHGDPHFNATFVPWLATLPRRGEILTADGMSPAEVAMVQGGPLVRERSRNNQQQLKPSFMLILAW